MAYTRLPDADELEGLGLTVEDFEETVEVWPDNWKTWCLFERLATQWRFGMNGRTGLDYGAVYGLLDRLELSTDKWWATFNDIQRLEVAAMEAMHQAK